MDCSRTLSVEEVAEATEDKLRAPDIIPTMESSSALPGQHTLKLVTRGDDRGPDAAVRWPRTAHSQKLSAAEPTRMTNRSRMPRN
jgi:hypothetical protein